MNIFDKYYFEKYALLSICHLCKLDIKEFERKDKPDLQSQTYNMGIEVVRAITEYDGFEQSLINTYLGKGLSGDEIVASIRQNNSRGRFKGTVESINGIAVFSRIYGPCDANMHIKPVIEQMKNKSLLYATYRHYKTNGLYCFVNTRLISEFHYPSIIEACRQSTFSLIFINCIDTMLQWTATSDNLIKHKISSELLSEWDRSAQNK